jgi:hypothetical protein
MPLYHQEVLKEQLAHKGQQVLQVAQQALLVLQVLALLEQQDLQV